MVREILLGDNPFIGVSHLAQEKAREERRELDLARKIEVIEAGIDGGVTGFTFSTHQLNLELLEYIAREKKDLLYKLNYYILVPYAQQYVRKANILGTAGLIKNFLVSALKPSRIKWLLPPRLVNIATLFIEFEVEPYLKILPRDRVKAILLHEVLTELIIAYNLVDLIKNMKKYFEKKGLGFGVETRNIGQLKAFLEKEGISVEYIMTPMNPLGYQMAPSKEEAEKAIVELASRYKSKIIAINPLASGAITITQACKYLEKYREQIYAVAYGTSKPTRARENAKIIKMSLFALE